MSRLKVLGALVLASAVYATPAHAAPLQFSTTGVFCADAAFTIGCTANVYTNGGITITFNGLTSPVFDVPPPSNTTFGAFTVTGGSVTDVALGGFFRLTITQLLPASAAPFNTTTFAASLQGIIRTGNSQGFVLFSEVGPKFIGAGSYTIVERDEGIIGRSNLSIPGNAATSVEGEVTIVPEPGSLMLLGTGLFGIARVARRRRTT